MVLSRQLYAMSVYSWPLVNSADLVPPKCLYTATTERRA